MKFIQECFPNTNIDNTYEDYQRIYKERLLTTPLEIKIGFFELVEFLKKHNVKLALCSSSSFNIIKTVLKNSNIDEALFETMISGDMHLKLKPNPDPYLKACEILNTLPKNTIAFEDSQTGVLSAKNAGIKCFLIPDRAKIESTSDAFAVCKTLAETIPVIEDYFFGNKKI